MRSDQLEEEAFKIYAMEYLWKYPSEEEKKEIRQTYTYLWILLGLTFKNMLNEIKKAFWEGFKNGRRK